MRNTPKPGRRWNGWTGRLTTSSHTAHRQRFSRKINADFKPDKLTDFLEEIRRRSQFHYWLFGHYHDNRIIDEKYVLLYEQMVQIL